MAVNNKVVGLLGRKIGMTQVYDDAGRAVPVTVVEAGPCDVLQVRTADRDGYEAVQVGYLDKPRRLASRSQRGQVARLDSKRSRRLAAGGVESAGRANCEPKRFVREIRGPAGDLEVGARLEVGVFEGISRVDVVATSKGRGFAGAMKRHNFSGQRASHGVKKCHRHLGGTGCSAYPSRLFKGVRMPGQYGAKRATVRNQRLVRVDAERNLLLIGGAVPGPNGGFVVVKGTNKL
jgi:large subunit ribosomal protein L3